MGKLDKNINKEALVISVLSTISGLIFLYVKHPGLLPIKENLEEMADILFDKIGK